MGVYQPYGNTVYSSFQTCSGEIQITYRILPGCIRPNLAAFISSKTPGVAQNGRRVVLCDGIRATSLPSNQIQARSLTKLYFSQFS
jgi:hypothetical protein